MIDLALDALAVHRLTRLITLDTITEPPREALIAVAYGAEPGSSPNAGVFEHDTWAERVEHDSHAPKLAELLICRWCMSIWISAAVVLVRRTRWWPPVRLLLALSSASTLLAQLEG